MLNNARFSALASTWSPSYDRYLLSDERHKPTILEMIEKASLIEGLQGIELLHPQHVNAESIQGVRSALDQSGLVAAIVAASISSKGKYRGGALTADNPETRREAIETVKTSMDLAVELGTDRVYLWLGREGYDYSFQIDYNLYWERLIEALQEIGSHNSQIKVCLNYKIKEPRRWLLASTAPRTILLAEEVGLPNIGVMIDTGHAMMANENPAESVALLARYGRLFHAHFNDNTRVWDDDMVVGSLNFLSILEMLYWLDRVGYDGWIGFDPHPLLEDASRMVEVSLRYIKGMIAVMEHIGREAIETAIATHQVTDIMELVGEQIFSKSW